MNVELLAVIMGSSLALWMVKTIYTEIKEWIKKRKEAKPFAPVFDKVSEVYETLNEMLVELGADRVVLLRSHNGGGKPQLGHPLFSSVEYEAWTRDLHPIRRAWNKQRVDEVYIKMLKKLDGNGCINIYLDSMENGMLKQLYFVNHVLASKVFKIHETENDYYYLSVNFNKTTDIDNAIMNEKCRIYVNELINLFQ
jgi:hypothetical protein